MEKVCLKTAELIAAILLGFILKKAKKFTAADMQTISKLVINFTLPCVIIKSLSNITLGMDLLTSALIGAGANFVLLALVWLFFHKRDNQGWMEGLFSVTTFNISSYAVPVLSPFVSAETMAGVLAFNFPTSIFTYAVIPSCAALYAQGARRDSTGIAQKLLHSPPTMTCLTMFLLAALRISLPQPIVGVISSFAAANTFLAMLVVGSLMDFPLSCSMAVQNLMPAFIRFCAACIMALSVFYLIPINSELRRALTMALFSPAASCCPMLAMHSGYRGGCVAATNSVYLLISVAAMSLLSAVLY